MSPRPYLLSWKLEGRKVLIVGAGEIAVGKIESLRGTGARIKVVAEQASARVVDLAEQGAVELSLRRFRPTDVIGVALVVAATNDRRINERIRRWSKLSAAVVNVVDDPALCDVTVPSVVVRGPATIAVSTNGASPAASRFLREELEGALPEGVGPLMERAAAVRNTLRHSGTYRYDYPAWRDRFLSPGLAAVKDGRVGSLDELERRFVAGFSSSTSVRTGNVTLVGAGPGGLDQLTLGGARALASADVVVYDRLVDPAILDLAPVVAERIPMGKFKGGGALQADIIDVLIDQAKAGFSVVRLKGGDPFVFGRGMEEVEGLQAADVPVSVVPGVSSALGGPGLAGIPLTHRGVASSFTVLSGHRIEDDDYDWSAIARSADTLVVLMGVSTAASLARRLIGGGRPEHEPVAVLSRCGRPDAEATIGTLGQLASEGARGPSPAIIVIGQVVALSDGHGATDIRRRRPITTASSVVDLRSRRLSVEQPR